MKRLLTWLVLVFRPLYRRYGFLLLAVNGAYPDPGTQNVASNNPSGGQPGVTPPQQAPKSLQDRVITPGVSGGHAQHIRPINKIGIPGAHVWILTGLLLFLSHSTYGNPRPRPIDILRTDADGSFVHLVIDQGGATTQFGNFQFDANNNLKVNCLLGCSASAGFTDNSAFTNASTTVNNIAGVFNDSITSLTSGNAGAIRATTDRMLFVNIGKINGTAPSMTGSSLNINCTGGCGGASSFLDNAAFTAGTTAVNITGGWFSNSPTACTSGSACAPSLTSDRKLFVQDFQGTSPWIVSASGNFGVTQQTSPWVDNVTQWASGVLGAMANYGTSPGAVLVPGVNAFITNTPTVTANAGTNLNTSALQLDATGQASLVAGGGTTAPSKVQMVGGKTNDGTAQYDIMPEGAGGRSVIVEGFAGGTAVPVSGTFFQTTQPVSCTAANCAINVAQVAGAALGSTAVTNFGTAPAAAAVPGVNSSLFIGTAAPDTNTGNASAQTQRVVLASNQPAVAVSGTVTANIGTTNGLALDASKCTGATGSAVPANGCYDAGNGSGNLTGRLQCDGYAFYDASTNGATQLVALVSGKVIFVCGYSFTSSSSTANTLKLVYGTGSNCATGQTAMTPGYVLQAAASTGPIGKVIPPTGLVNGLKTAVSNALCVLTNAAQAAQAEVWYTQF